MTDEVKNPNAGESGTPESAKQQAPNPSESEATAMPSANAPDPKAANPETNPNAAKSKAKEDTADDQDDKKPAAKAGAGEKKPAAAKGGAKEKKEKPPEPEDKPFPEFIQQHFIPNLKETLANQGVQDLDLKFEKRPLPIPGYPQTEEFWQVTGNWQNGKRQFLLMFQKEDISGPKFWAAADNGAHPTLLESFMIDERRVNLDLMVFYVVQRLNGQKWLARN